MTEKRSASRDVLERLAEAVSQYMGGNAEWAFSTQIGEALKVYRAATDPLRTRAEVDAELCVEIREYMRLRYQVDNTPGDQLQPIWTRMSELCSEPTTDSGSSSATAAKESRDNAGVSAGPAKEPEALPWDAEDQKLADPCSCDEAIELRRVIKHVHSLALEVARVTEGT